MLLERKCILFIVSICLLRFSTEQEELFPASEYFVSFVSTMREKKKPKQEYSFWPAKTSNFF